ncbi:MAG: biotin--[Elusimicrobiaceae bacterium]|nr:biotin--[acetyl-CoA-carboxylase] ligase [Elusimicrobiaceae bacterium]
MNKELSLQQVTKVIGLASAKSTQTLAKEMALNAEPEGTLVLAEQQTAGRGRYERHFSSARGGIYFTLILRPYKPASCNASLSVRTGQAVAHTLSSLFGIRTKIKLPNDVLAWDPKARRWKKICGILIETAAGETTNYWVLVGVGININNRLPAALKETAVNLKQLIGMEADRELFLEKLLENFWKEYACWQVSCR